MLDMGEVVKIVDLAHKMISLMGHTVKDDANPDGDIAIEYTGLRPGEKLYEELLIGDNVSGTEHPKIMKAKEGFVSQELMQAILDDMALAIDKNDSGKLRQLLMQLVSEYQPSGDNVDWGAVKNNSSEKVVNLYLKPVSK